jgi:IS1 family transposase
MNRLPRDRRAAIVRALVDGASIRATARICGVDKETVTKLLEEVGDFAEFYQHHALVKLNCTTVELDEIWSFVGAKEGNKTREEHGDLWTYTAVCADSKLVFSWLVGSRVTSNTEAFCADVASRLTKRVQISTDMNHTYLTGIEKAFGWNGCDFGQVKKEFASTSGPRRGSFTSSSEVISVEKVIVFGNPDESKISTAYVERQNLTMRMNMRRFTRMTNAFSKKAKNHAYAVALHYLVYNYVRPHGTLTKAAKGVKTTPAMAAGVTARPWTVEHILAMIDGEVMCGKAA